MSQLRGKVAVITGASRGVGRGIALVLGEAGATVYVTGRSVRGGPTTDGLPGTVEDTAEAVSARGGAGVAVHCDHTADAEVEALFGRVRHEQGRLDVLVNNAWGGYEGKGPPPLLPFWETPRRYWEAMFVAGVRAHLVASQLAVPLMLPPGTAAPGPAVGICQKCLLPVRAGEPAAPGTGWGFLKHQRDCVGELERVPARGMIVSTVAWAQGKHIGNVFYDTCKAAVNRLVAGMAHELRPHGIAAVALAPGFVRTERVMAAHAAHPFDLGGTESPEYAGRAVAALATDPGVLRKSGGVLTAGDLAREYGFTDVDGRQPEAFRVPGPD